jgi:hypothetical protein
MERLLIVWIMGFLKFLPSPLARPADNPDYTQGIPQPIVRAGDSAAPFAFGVMLIYAASLK